MTTDRPMRHASMISNLHATEAFACLTKMLGIHTPKGEYLSDYDHGKLAPFAPVLAAMIAAASADFAQSRVGVAGLIE